MQEEGHYYNVTSLLDYGLEIIFAEEGDCHNQTEIERDTREGEKVKPAIS